MFLLDTNAVSEPGRPRPDPGYMSWLATVSPRELHISALTIGELRYGLLCRSPGARRDALEAWIVGAVGFFPEGRILPFDRVAAERWAVVWRGHAIIGRTVDVVDEQVAATALANGLTVVTRNVRHFEHSGCPILSPWTV